jgi:pimeloyl-ACP methyl ester carboxylesterase
MKHVSLLFILVMVTGFSVVAQPKVTFTNFNSANTPVFSGNNFKAVGVGKGNRIWAGTQYQGLYWYDTARNAWTYSGLFNNLFINHIIADKKGGIWIGQSGTSGSTGGASNVAGGINYFADTTNQYQYFGSNQFLPSRNVRSIYLDEINGDLVGARRLWATMGTYITSSNTAAGGIIRRQDSSTGNVQRVWEGLQVLPNTNTASAGTPSCYGIASDGTEIWVGAEQNYQAASGSSTQILKYDAYSGKHLGGYDQNGEFDNERLVYNNQQKVYINNSTQGIFSPGFRTTAMHVDKEKRWWIGLRFGGLVVKMGSQWLKIDTTALIPAGAMINFNAIASDKRGNVYIGTSNGLLVFQYGGDPGLVDDYKRYTTTDGLPSNNITGIALDTAREQMVLTSDAGVTFMSFKNKIDVKLVWDYSCPSRLEEPIGVAADGVSRVYLKIKKASDTLPDIREVKVSLKDFTSNRAGLRGKLKKAITINGYSEEANSGTSNEIIIYESEIRPNPLDQFWAWYISPENFSMDSLSAEAKLRRRYDTLVVEVTYMNNKKDTMEYNIAVVRPPTVFVHGLAADEGTWDGLYHFNRNNFTKFVNSPLLTYSRALKMDPAGFFRKNAMQLLGGDLSTYAQTADQLNTLQGTVDAIRRMGYASNQVDYVCHSMGGIMIREAIGVFSKKFYAGYNQPYSYKTYTKGFTHKIITVNTPHNSSPVADAVDEFVPKAPWLARIGIDHLYLWGKSVIGFDVPSFFLPIGSSRPGNYIASEAVENLQVTDSKAGRNGINLLETRAKYHMITGNLNWQLFNFIEDVDAMFFPKLYKVLLQIAYGSTYDSENFNQAYAAETRAELKKLMAESEDKMLFGFLHWYSARHGFPNFFSEGDGVVPLMSETARQPITSSFVTPFLNSPGSIKDAHHIFILGRHDIGQCILHLLNTSISDSKFGDVIPPNTDPDPVPYTWSRPIAGSTQPARPLATEYFFDTTKIRIDAPARFGTLNGDSMVNVRFRLKDTSRLAFVIIHLQSTSTDSFRLTKTLAPQTVSFKVDPAFLGSTTIYAMAVYDRATQDGVNYYADSVTVNVQNLAPLQGFRAVEDVVEIRTGKAKYIHYEAKYNNVWVPLATTDPDLRVVSRDAAVLVYDSVNAEFSGLKNGVALAGISYKTFSDSVLFRVIEPYNANCINSTVASGSFKNAATWSKGVVPGICDSVIINTGHAVTVDTSVTVRSVRINSGGTLTINNAAYTLQLGQLDDGSSVADSYGSLNISRGKLGINGRLRLNSASSFNMTGGSIVIDGNSNVKETSIEDGTYLFDVSPAMQSFNLGGDTIQLIDPPFGAVSQAINCTYNFGINSTLILGNGVSLDKSQNNSGFGGNGFPPIIGNLVLDGATAGSNRQLTITKPLNVKGSFLIKTNSSLRLQSEVRVTQ